MGIPLQCPGTGHIQQPSKQRVRGKILSSGSRAASPSPL